MSHEWPERPVSELCELVVDCVNKTAPTVPDQTPYRMIRTTNVKAGRLNMADCKYVDELTYKTWTRRAVPRRGDVLLTREAPMGEAAIVRDEEGIFLGQRLVQYRAQPGVLDPRFLLYSFLSPALQAQFRSFGGAGSTVDHIRVPDCARFRIPTPPYAVQRDIADLLGALDDKIDLNRRMNETLEAMARSIFKSWFVDFDPVRTEREGGAPVRVDAATALFPERFEKSALGEVPRGWRVGPYGAGLTVVKGKSYKSNELQSSDTALVTLKSFLRGGGYREDGLKEYVGEFKPEQVVLPGEVVVAFTDVTQAAEVIGRPARVRADARYSTLVASLDVGIVRPTVPELPPEYLYYCFLEPSFTDHTYAHANGSTVLHLAAGAVEKYEGLWPDARVASAFVEIVRPLLQRQDANWAECDTLANLRDLLLPRLLSGELRVRDADRIVDRAV